MQLRIAPAGALILAALVCTAVASGQQAASAAPAPANETLIFGAEWRFVRAGDVELKWTGDRQADLKLKSAGIVAALYKVDDTYRAIFDPGYCATSLSLDAQEGRRHRDTKVAFDREKKKASYLEKDVNTGATVLTKELDVPACVHDVTGGLRRLRQMRPEPGTTTELPISDGKKVVMARIEAQARENVRTPMGQFSAIRYEAYLFNGVLYARKGRMFIWISDDDKRLPVQIKVQLPFYVGTITVQLEKAQ